MKKINSAWLIVIVLLACLNSGCNKEELERLRFENQQLKNRIALLEEENKKLKETADYHYKSGMDFLAAKDYNNAKKEFEMVIKKYPSSSLINSAQEQLDKVKKELGKIEVQRLEEKKRRKEEEKYRPRSDYAATQEWKKFRKNEKKMIGTVTTWEIQASVGYGDDLSSWVGNGGFSSLYGVIVECPDGKPYKNCVFSGKFPEVKDEDWVRVTGKFHKISSNNKVILRAIKVKNMGYAERGERP